MAIHIDNKKYSVIKKDNYLNTDITITKNGRYVASDTGIYTGYGIVEVNVPNPPLQQKTVNVSATANVVIKPDSGYYGLSQVTVNKVNSSVDANIIPANIRKGKTILGVTGTLEYITDALTINPMITKQVINPTHDGFGTVTVNPVTSGIDANIKPENIKKGVSILGVTGQCVEAYNNTITISKNGQYDVQPPYTGYSQVKVKVPLEEININATTSPQVVTHPNNGGYNVLNINPVDATIDPEIKPENIRKGINILGVEGNINIDKLKVYPSTTQQVITPTEPGLTWDEITVAPVSSAIDVNIQEDKILAGTSILGVDGTLVLDETTITPKTTSQILTHDGVGGWKRVTVQPVTADIDKNIKAYNIKQGVSILGVTGTLRFEHLEVAPSLEHQTFMSSGAAYDRVDVSPVTAAIDENIKPQNILKGKTILGIEGTIDFETLTVNPTTEQQILTPTKNGYNKVTVQPVTATIDSNIKSDNIKSGVTILGVTGAYEHELEELVVDPKTETQIFTSTKDGFSKVTVNAVPKKIDIDISPTNIRQGIDILGVLGTLIESKETSINIDNNGTYTPPEGFTGFNNVTVDVTPSLGIKDVTPTGSRQTITLQPGEIGYKQINVAAADPSVDENIKAENIKQGVNILGVNGTCIELKGQSKYINTPGTFTPDEGYNAITEVTVDMGATATQSLNVSENGTYMPEPGYRGFDVVNVDVYPNLEMLTINPSTSKQTYSGQDAYSGYDTVIINPVTSEIDTNIQPGNIKEGVTILGVTGTSEQTNTQEKLVIVNDTTKTVFDVMPDEGFNGISKLTVDMSWIENKLQQLNGNTITINRATNLQQLFANANGTYTPTGDYEGFSEVVVEVPTNTQESFSGFTLLTDPTVSSMNNLTLKGVNITEVSQENACEEMWDGNSRISKVDLNELKTVSGSDAFDNAFRNCENLIEADLSNLVSVTPHIGGISLMFVECKNLETLNLHSLRYLTGTNNAAYMCAGCKKLTSIDLSSLESIGAYGLMGMFMGSGITDITFDSLTELGLYAFSIAFYDCFNLKSVSFPALNSQSFKDYQVFPDMLHGVTDCIIHFPENLSNVLSFDDGGLLSNLGGEGTLVSFDLPATY